MRLAIQAIGRMKSGPERELLDRFVERADKAGRQIGVTKVYCQDFAESRARDSAMRRTEEAEILMGAAPNGAFRIALDERGQDVTSTALAELVRRESELARPEITFLIGGPDGHGKELLDSTELRLRFGAMTWPHQIVRVLAAEQIYRVITILTGHPYHRA